MVCVCVCVFVGKAGWHWDPGCWTSCMPVCPHHAHVNSRHSTGCVMSLFTTRGQWMRSSAMPNGLSPRAGKTKNVVCLRVCVHGMSLCISLCLCEAGGGINRSARERRWANEQARANFCVCMKPTTSLRGIFSIIFQHLQLGLFLIRRNTVYVFPHVFPNHIYIHLYGDVYRNTQTSTRITAFSWLHLKVHVHGDWISQVINNFQ